MIAVFATGPNFEFGNENKLPWISCREDLQRFKELTLNKVILMGADTFRSLPALLPNRIHVVLTRDSLIHCKNGERPHYIHSGDFKRCIEEIKQNVGDDIAVIGGPAIIGQAVEYGEVKTMYITTLDGFDEPLEHDVKFNYHCLLKEFELKSAVIKDGLTRIQKTPVQLTERTYERISKPNS